MRTQPQDCGHLTSVASGLSRPLADRDELGEWRENYGGQCADEDTTTVWASLDDAGIGDCQDHC